jgi:hypothetical protein
MLSPHFNRICVGVMPANENVFLGRLLFSEVSRVPQGIIGKTSEILDASSML